MKRHILPALAFAALAGCAAGGQGAPPSSGQALAGPVSYEVHSWGRLLAHWRVNPDGTGEFWRGAGVGKGLGDVSKYRMTLSPQTLRNLAAAIEPIRADTRGGVPCTDEITDMPYGAITWDYPGAKQSYDFDGGCISPRANAVRDRIAAAHAIVEQQTAIEPAPYAVEKPAS